MAKYQPPTGMQLAREIYERCLRARDRLHRTRAHTFSTSPLYEQGSVGARRIGVRADAAASFVIVGQSPAEHKAFERALLKRSGTYALEKHRAKGSQETDVGSEFFGYEMRVVIFTEPVFDVMVESTTGVPAELLQCVKATYNALLDEVEDADG